jgi:Ca2+-binding RTX toxin-like protein
MGDGRDIVRVEGGAVTIWGQRGADTFHIYSGSGWINGGAGDDLFTVRGSSGLILSGSTGNDHFSIRADATALRLYGGDGADVFSGNAHSVTGSLWGGAGNDSFLDFGDAGGGAVTLRGGTGNDVYRINADSPPEIIEQAGEGRDTVQVAAGTVYMLGSNLENLTVFGSSADPTEMFGNALANRITGGAGVEFIDGGAGNDRLYGLGSSDDISGGAGADRIYGGLGRDYLAGDGGADVYVYESAAEATYSASVDFWENDGDAIIMDSLDRIDVSAIDANSSLPGVQHFTWGDGDHEQGTLEIYALEWGGLGVFGYIDADDQPDFYLEIYGETDSFVVSDSFILA